MRYASVGNDMYIEGVEASPDGRHILISGKDHDKHNKMVRFFELEDGIQMEPEQPGNGSQPKTDQEWFVSEMSIGDYVRAAAWDEQEKYCAFTDSQTVYVTDTKGNLLFKTGKARLTPRSLCIHDNVLFVLYSEGRLARYDLYSGEELGVTQIAYLSTAGSGELPLRTPLNNSEWIFRNDVLIIARGDFFHIIETQSWKEIARSESIFGYDSQKGKYAAENLIEMIDCLLSEIKALKESGSDSYSKAESDKKWEEVDNRLKALEGLETKKL
jgi:hypothetical protein